MKKMLNILKIKAHKMYFRSIRVLHNSEGQSGVDMILGVLAGVVIVGILITLFVAAIKNDWFPDLTEKITTMIGIT